MPQKPLKILQASAGSGKTFSLTAHYLTLLFAGETRYREILAVTFTNKATEEMKSRILQVLRGLALGDKNVGIFRNIILNAHPHFTEQTLQQQAFATYRRILHDYSRFSINTIDGFVQKVIRSFTFELGLDAGYRLEMNTDKVKRELAVKLNQQLDQKPGLLRWIIDLALERIRDDKNWNYHETLIDLAGELFKERYQPFENALKAHDPEVLFKDLQKAVKEIIAFFEETVTEQARKAYATFSASEVQLAELKGKSRSPLASLEKVMDGDFAKVVNLGKLVDQPEEWQKDGPKGDVAALYNELNPQLSALYSFYTSETPAYLMSKAIDANLYYLRLMQEMAGLLKDYRQENSVLLISDAQNLLKGITGGQDDNPSFIWEKMGNRYRHFLFDEFQDTSAFQWQNFLPLLKNAIAEANGALIDHLIVGDVKQSIYRWRNGDWRILHTHAKKHVGDLRVHDDVLLENYRSAANVIDFNNFVFQYAPDFLQAHINAKVMEDGGDVLFHEWWKTEGYDDVINAAYGQSSQQKAPSTLPGGSVEVCFLPTGDNRNRAGDVREAALEKMACTLNDWISSGAYQPGQVCILVRSNREAREVIEHLMRDQQRRETSANNNEIFVPYEVLSGEALLVANHSVIRLLVNTLQAMVARKKDGAIFKATAIYLYNKLHNRTVVPGLWIRLNELEPGQLAGYLPPLLCENWHTWQQLPLPELVEQLIGAYGVGLFTDNIPYLLAFRDMVSVFTRLGERGITTFLTWWEEEGQQKSLPSSGQNDAVQVMTIHKSKGLAFDVVMLPFCSWSLDGMANSIFWVDTADTPYAMLNSVPVHYKKSLGKSAFAKAYFEELLFNFMDALNMLYVATTRTRNHLYITAPAANDDNLGLVGDLLLKSLQLHASALPGEFNGERFEVIAPVKQPPPAAAANSWSFIHYPLSNRLNESLTDHQVLEQLDLLSGNTAQRRGVILHELLARSARIEELRAVTQKMMTEGWFRKTEEPEILELAESVMLQPDLRKILDNPYERFNEQTIISGAGKSYRPDKVLVGKDHVVIVDFKFTGEPKPGHYSQVEEYRGLLLEMGYRNIEAYLYYGYLKELKVV
ncbi:UvrD-helicase domain-containing protein [Hufsiella ginkgonis]|uniref:DNA 3'-5' helicase n=1 Tax=Hufsiella ginkgonis TaxID=2695274 RepID=A0A7K1XRV0_9SPHI|nr:UvrD-helicase domain-containing protein [Hufsiella ginkgonis]MXV13718.1 UvrD-helicase domain-containing protein [Hufsiella ginkgonis]